MAFEGWEGLREPYDSAMLTDEAATIGINVNALGPVPEAARLSCNDGSDLQGSTLVAGQPFTAHLTVGELAPFVRRVDRICGMYTSLATDRQIEIDLSVLASLRALVPLHERICAWVDEQPDHVASNRSSVSTSLVCSHPIPLGIVALGSMILAADAAIDILRRQAAPANVPAARWVDHYRKHLRKTINRADDICHKALSAQKATARA